MKPDIGVAFIKRTPSIDYVRNSVNPSLEGWPAVDQPTAWVGVVNNYSNFRYSQVGYEWQEDGIVVEKGFFDLDGNSTIELTLNATWKFDRKMLKLRINPNQTEDYVANNEREVASNALSIGFYVEKSFYQYHLQNRELMEMQIYSFEDWVQSQVSKFNLMLASSGVEDLFRIDNIRVIEDDELPLNKDALSIGDSSGVFDRRLSIPNLDDKTVDIQWGFASYLLKDLKANNSFLQTGFLLHEMCHARYLTDNYGFDVYHSVANSKVLVTENGHSIVDTYFYPQKVNLNNDEGYKIYSTKEDDLMGAITPSPKLFLKEYSKSILNYIKGQRALVGNWNSPEDVNKVFNRIPAKNVIAINKGLNAPCSQCKVSVFQAKKPDVESPNALYARNFQGSPDFEYLTDGDGVFVVGEILFAGKGKIVHTRQYSNACVLIRVESPEHEIGYFVIQASDFNIEYMAGNIVEANYEFTVTLR